MASRPARTFGSAFRRDLDEAKSGYTAPGGGSDGSSALGTDYDQELRHDIKPTARRAKGEAEAGWKRRIRYPTTRFGRIVRSIRQEVDATPESSPKGSDVSGW